MISRRCRTRFAICLVPLALALLTACGHDHHSDAGLTADSDQLKEHGGLHWGNVYRKDVRSVCVPIFSSKDFHRGVEMQLTDAIDKKIEEFTPYKVEPRERADTILEGEIVSITPLTYSLSPFTATPQEQQYSIVVNFTWRDLHTGKILVQRNGFEQTTTFFPTLGEGQWMASQNTVEKLALDIVNELESTW